MNAVLTKIIIFLALIAVFYILFDKFRNVGVYAFSFGFGKGFNFFVFANRNTYYYSFKFFVVF